MAIRDFAVLALLAALIYLPGLTTHGVTNWQEGQRLVVAREMQLRGDWLMPTVNGQPYLAKPPLIYWCQIALAKVRGVFGGDGVVRLVDLRLTVALAGILGVLATYWAGRQIFDPAHRRDACATSEQQFARDAAFWGAAMLATGLLAARSARIGELDILLIPSVALAVGAIARAWRAHRERRTTDFVAVAIAVIGACMAALAKGPPGLLVIALAAYGGIALSSAYAPTLDTDLWGMGIRRNKSFDPLCEAPTFKQRFLVAIFAALGVSLDVAYHNNTVFPLTGWSLHAAMAFAVGWAFAGVLSPRRAWACFVALSRTHPVAVLGVPLALLWCWWHFATGELTPADRDLLLSQEAEDNLRLFVIDSPLRNLEAASYGVGLGSLAAIATLVWMIQRKPTFAAGWFIVLAWALLPLVAMSWLGKGVPRYLTPAWPGIALLGGLGIAHLLHTRTHMSTRLRTTFGTCILALGAALSIWYGYGREVFNAWRSPREFVAALTAYAHRETERVAPSDKLLVCSYEFQTPALDAYLGGAGRSVIPVGNTGVNNSMMGGPAWTLDELRTAVAQSHDGVIVLVRETQPSDRTTRPPIEALQSVGLIVKPIPIVAEFRIDGGRTRIGAVRVYEGLPAKPKITLP